MQPPRKLIYDEEMGEAMSSENLGKYQVMVYEGAEIATYYTRAKPEIVEEGGEKFLRFIPRNGIVNRVGHINDVPFDRIIAIVTVEEIDLDESAQG